MVPSLYTRNMGAIHAPIRAENRQNNIMHVVVDILLSLPGITHAITNIAISMPQKTS